MRYYIAAVLLIVLLLLVPRSATADAPPLTLDDVFPPRDLSSLGLDESRLRVLIATGDVIPARSVDMRIRGRGNDFFYPLAKTADLLREGDLTVINLEAPLIRDCPPHDEGMQFCGQSGFAAALKKAGVDVATLENNHIGNYGTAGIQETVQNLEAQEIAWANRDTPAIVDVRGTKFGFLAFTDKFITYAHGNFIFDQMWSDETRTGVVGRYTFYDNTLVGVEYTPVQLYEYAQPRGMTGQAAQAVLQRMAAASREQARIVTEEAR
ncbi:MAG: CapA family protein [Anaerolineae bacterium]